ncbi:hypothetical protein KAW65_04555 [candidate division WOR-3 bacterium]|nr:hypothetical protein [candidate division WOR-3 bacterium]
MSIFLFIFLQVKPPALELPKVVIYGQREVRLKIIKGELIPDTIPSYELPVLSQAKLESKKSHCPVSYKGLSSIIRFKGCLGREGSSGEIEGFYGKENYSLTLSYLKDIERLKGGLHLKLGGGFKNTSFGACYEIKDYIERGKYSVFKMNLSYTLPTFFIKTDAFWGELEKEKKELFFTTYGNFSIPLKASDLSIIFCAMWDSLPLFSLGGKVRYNLETWGIEPGVKILSEKPYLLPHLKLGNNKIWLEYLPFFKLRTRDEALRYNRFVNSKIHIDKRKILRAGGQFLDYKLNFEWIEDYPYFFKSDSSYLQGDTTILAIEALMCQKLGTNESPKATIKLRYNLTGTPEYIPRFIGSLNVNWIPLTFNLDYGCRDYNYLDFKITWAILNNLSLFLDVRNLFNEGEEIFKVYYEPEQKILFGLNLKL